MIKIEDIAVYNMENAIRGMRHPLESYTESDSTISFYPYKFTLGEKDRKLAFKLIKAGSDHSKFMRQIFISIDITAPLYWWKEMDQYKVSTTTNSTSTMHTIHKKGIINTDLFSFDEIDSDDIELCAYLEKLRTMYIETKDKKYWRKLIQRLPSSFNQKRTWTGNYQILRNIQNGRPNHKLIEWREFCKEFDNLPHNELILI